MRDAFGRHARNARSLFGDRGVVLAVLATVAGIGMVASGWIMRGTTYLPDVLLQVGSALVMLVPLVLLGWMIEVRLRRTEQRATSIATELTEVRQAVARLDDVGAATRARLEASRDYFERALAAVSERPTGRNVARLLDASIGASVVADAGVRVTIPGTELRLRLNIERGAADERLLLTIEHSDGTPIHELGWPPDVPADTVAFEVADALAVHNLYPGDDRFDASALLRQVLETVRTGINARTGPEVRLLGPLIEIPGRQWAIASDGLYSLDRDYRIPATRLRGSGEDWRAHMLSKQWVDRDDFLETYQVASALYRSAMAESSLGQLRPNVRGRAVPDAG